MAAISIARRPRALTRRRGRIGLLFVGPWIAGFVLLKALPICASLALSFSNFNMLHPDQTRFVGLENYLSAFGDPGAAGSLMSTIGYAVIAVPAQVLVSLGLAALLCSKRTRGKQWLRTLIFMPSVIPGLVILTVWFGFLDPNTGWLNRLFLQPLGLPPMAGPNSEAGFNFYLTLMTLWSIGPGFLIVLGAMQSVPEELHEAARVDGAGPLLRFWAITVPLVSPAIFFSLVIYLIGIFGGASLLDRGASFGAGQSAFDSYITSVMFGANELGYAASLSWILFALMLFTTFVLFRTADRWVHYAEEEEEA